MIAPVRSLGHYAYRWRGRIVLAALLVAVAAAIGSASVFDAVKPYGFQDPDSESARATEALEDASGERPLPDVVLIVEPSGGGPAKVRAAAAEAERRLADIPSVTRTAIEGLSEDKRAGLVVGYLDADVDDIADVGAKVEDTFGGLRFVTAGGAAVTAHQLNETTEDDLRRIELYAAPLLFLLSLLVFRGLVAAALPLVGRGALDRHHPAPAAAADERDGDRRVRGQHRDRARPRARDRLQPVRDLQVPGRARRRRSRPVPHCAARSARPGG